MREPGSSFRLIPPSSPPSILRGLSTALMLLGCALIPSCTLITDVDREDIPEPPQVLFPEDDAGADAATPPEPDAGVPTDAGAEAGDASTPVPTPDAGDAGAGDAGADAGI